MVEARESNDQARLKTRKLLKNTRRIGRKKRGKSSLNVNGMYAEFPKK
jgi:hypothetical protein